MSRGFVGLDNVAFQGNLRTYRRREAVRPPRQPVRPAGILDDVNLSEQNTSFSPNITEKKVNKNQQESPLKVPARAADLAGTSIVETDFLQVPKKVTQDSRTQSRRPLAKQLDDWHVTSEQMESQNQEAFQPKKIEQPKPSKFRFLRRVPFFGKLTKKDLLSLKFALPAMAVIIFLVGCGIAIQGVMTNRHVKAQVANNNSGGVTGYDPTGQGDVPDETVPNENAGPYIVAPDMPRYIRINKIGVTSRVVRVGVKPNNELIAPNNIHTVGWYEGSTLPGKKGTALMDAHVHGPTMPGAFYRIHDLDQGDQIEIERGDGKKFEYRVVSKESVPYQSVDMAKAMRSIEDGKNGLNLITCGGKYNRDAHMYEERVVVYAVQI